MPTIMICGKCFEKTTRCECDKAQSDDVSSVPEYLNPGWAFKGNGLSFLIWKESPFAPDEWFGYLKSDESTCLFIITKDTREDLGEVYLLSGAFIPDGADGRELPTIDSAKEQAHSFLEAWLYENAEMLQRICPDLQNRHSIKV